MPWDAMVPLKSLVDRPGAAGLTALGMPLRGFAAFPSNCRTVWTTLCDCEEQPPDGGNTERGVSVYAVSGRVLVDPAAFAALDEATSPDFTVAPADVQSAHTGRKRQGKCVERTGQFLDAAVAAVREPRLRLFASVVGGADLEWRAQSAKHAAARPVAGFFIEGLTHGLSAKSRREVVSTVVPLLPEDRPRGVRCSGHPVEVLELVAAGIDMFDSPFPFVAAERGEALAFVFGRRSDDDGSCGAAEASSRSSSASAAAVASPVGDRENERFSFSLWDTTHAADFTPLYPGSVYTRAYVHHLLMTHEMLATVALAAHNLTWYLAFFNDVRESIRRGDFDALHADFLARYTAVSEDAPS
jgi:queuine tRNA-ribosyltransferase subunit QTRTD1